MHNLLQKFSFLLCLSLATLAAAGESRTAVSPDDVQFTSLDEGFRIEIEMLAPVPLATAWKVLTDFNGMAKFASNLISSRVVASSGNQLRIEQVGFARFGPLSHHFDSVREITLLPMKEILARQISGSSRRMESRMRLKTLPDGTTSLSYRVEVVPETRIPPLIGPAFVRHEVAEQFSAIIAEMQRRQTALATPAPAPPSPAAKAS